MAHARDSVGTQSFLCFPRLWGRPRATGGVIRCLSLILTHLACRTPLLYLQDGWRYGQGIDGRRVRTHEVGSSPNSDVTVDRNPSQFVGLSAVLAPSLDCVECWFDFDADAFDSSTL